MLCRTEVSLSLHIKIILFFLLYYHLLAWRYPFSTFLFLPSVSVRGKERAVQLRNTFFYRALSFKCHPRHKQLDDIHLGLLQQIEGGPSNRTHPLVDKTSSLYPVLLGQVGLIQGHYGYFKTCLVYQGIQLSKSSC